MDQGGGGGVTTLDHFVKSSSSTGLFLHRKRDQSSSFMELDGGTAAARFPGAVELVPVSLNPSCRDGGEKRKVAGEVVDFFSHDVQKVAAGVGVKKEEHGRRDGGAAAPAKLNLDVNTGLNLLTANTGSDQSTVDDGISPNSDEKKGKNELVALQMELERMNEENQRLRSMLTQVSSNYSSLQLHLMAMMQQQGSRNTVQSETHNRIPANKMEEPKQNEGESSMVPRQFMDLGPAATADTDEPSQSSSGGRTTRSDSPRNNKNQEALSKLEYQSHKVVSCGSEINAQLDHHDKQQPGRDGREGSSDRESPAWVANKLPKLSPSPTVEQSAEATMRKARVSVRARSEAPMITDGCQWRKYGQKMAKGNPCPRAYYRCTMAAGCPVRKQVQRCAEDRSILITTYEGNHNHPLPPAAMAMASTTSAAATMLLSGSMSSADGLMNSNFLARTMLPCSSSMATISASAPFPTVTLDLTQTPSPLQFQRPPAQFSLPFPGGPSPALASNPAASLGQIFGQSLYNQSKFSGLQLSPNIDTAQLMHHQQQAPAQHPSLVDTVSAATAAITADPNFTAALAAAITSIIGGGGVNQSAGNSSPAADNNNSNNNNNSNSITSK